MWVPAGRIVVATALFATACGHGAKGDQAPNPIGNASAGDGSESDAGASDAADRPPANPDEAWLYEVRELGRLQNYQGNPSQRASAKLENRPRRSC